MKYYYTQKEFQPGQVLKYLSNMTYTMIIGLDIGHGETKACLYCYEEGWCKESLNLDMHGNKRIPSYICYKGQRVGVGHDVDMFSFYQHFKLPPSRWKESLDGVHSIKEMQKDFADQVFWQIIGYNKGYDLRKAMADNSLLIVVSCPSSKMWLEADAEGDTYQKLMQKALAYEHVTILSEADAAMMRVIMDGNFDLSKGLAVFDLGSSTVDATYLLPGKKLISRSKFLGGHQIDMGILSKAAKEHNFRLTSLTDNQHAYLLTQIRKLKELFCFTYKGMEEKSLYLNPVDQAKKVQKYCTVQLTPESMHEILTVDPMACSDRQDSWYAELKGFFEEMSEAIGDRPCGAVILTGGTSRISEVKDAAQSVFGDIVRRADDPESAVVVGLCSRKSREMHIPSEFDGSAYYGTYVRCLTAYMRAEARQKMWTLMEYYPGERERKRVKSVAQELDDSWNGNGWGPGLARWITRMTKCFTEIDGDYSIGSIDLSGCHIEMEGNRRQNYLGMYIDESFPGAAAKKLRALTDNVSPELMNELYQSRTKEELQKLIHDPHTAVRDYREAAESRAAWNIYYDYKKKQERLSSLFVRHFLAIQDPELVADRIKSVCPTKVIAKETVMASNERGLLWKKRYEKVNWRSMLYRDNDLKNYFLSTTQTAYEMALGIIFLLLFEEGIDLQ